MDLENDLSVGEKEIYRQINKAHDFYSLKDRRYRIIVRLFKVAVLTLALLNTVFLGLGHVLDYKIQIIIGVVASGLISFFTALAAYFNFESYWMRNVQIHIKLNIMRDEFIYYASAKKLDEERVDKFRTELQEIQKSNINYWEKAMRGV